MFLLLLMSCDGHGSPAGAAHLRAIVEPIPNPKSGEGIDREYYAKRFPDGEWILGVSRDSHALMSTFGDGGTMVFKDSRGRIRCFFGHCCGPDAIRLLLYEAQTLDDVYDFAIKRNRYTEYEWH